VPNRRFILRTRGGYLLSEVVSALQKEIRRGQLDNAVYWSAELDLSGYGEYLWRRLRIITSEDVGPAWPDGPAVIDALYSWWQKHKSKRGGSPELFIVHAVILLCRSEKTRLVDHVLTAHYVGHDDELRREIPDYALDMHTARGREMGRGLDHFFDEGARVHPEAEDPDKAHYEALERDLLRKGRKPASRVRSAKDGDQASLPMEEEP
jgi:replication-associated recombination protein RarA